MLERSREQLGTALQAYVDLLVKLHELVALGEGNSEDSDALRDHMDVYWNRLNDVELAVARQLSADLHTMHDQRGSLVGDADFYSAELASEVGKAHDAGDILRALELLTERNEEISPSRAAIIRGMGYRELGFVQAGLLFMWHAANISSQPASAYIIALNTLWHYVDIHTAAVKAKELLRSGKIEGIAYFVVASIFLNAATQADGSSRAEYAEASKSLLEGILKSAPANEAVGAQARCHEMLSNCHFLLDETAHAIRELGVAIQLAPEDAELYVQRGLMRLDTDFQSAKVDFEQACALGTSSIWPYYYLAIDAFRSNDFERSASLATNGLSRSADLDLQAKLHELAAMSIASGSSSLSQSMISVIRSHFRAGIVLSPADQQILANSEVFEHALKAAIREHGWVVRPPVTSQRATSIALSERLPELVPCG